jgi:hypothetical protein
MSRLDIISRGLLVIGLIAGLATVGVIVGRQVFSESDAPKIQELGPLLGQSEVIKSAERDDLTSKGGRSGRSVLLAVPQALNQEQARTGLLRLLRSSGWRVSRGGGAIPSQGDVCLALSTASDWFGESANKDLRKDFESALSERGDIAVVADMFYCSEEETP